MEDKEILPEMEDREKKVTHEGSVVDAFPNAMFHVRLDNEDKVILGYISGKLRRSSKRILVGDRVKIEVSPYDKTKGRIIYRFPRIDKSYDSDDSDDSED